MIQQNEATGSNTGSKGPHPGGTDIREISKPTAAA